jgi:glucose/arabinose dehydrogenase
MNTEPELRGQDAAHGPRLIRRSNTWLIVTLVAAAIVLLSSRVSHGEVVTINVSADSFINSGSPANNAGGEGHVAIGTDNLGGVRRGLFRFDLRAIPVGSTVTSAVFRLNMVFEPFGAVDSTYDLFELTADWGEGVKSGAGGPGGENGAPATAGECTWQSRRVGSENWKQPGAGGDFRQPALTSVAVTTARQYEWTSPALVTVVQSWVNAQDSNFGLLMLSRSESTRKTAKRFGSREGGRPATLVIGYEAPRIGPEIEAVSVSESNILSLRWKSLEGFKYDVEYTASPETAASWQVAEANIPASATGANVWSDPPFAASPQNPINSALFYRLRRWPAAAPALPIALDVVVSNLVAPTVLTHAGDGSGRLFVAEQTGQIRVLDANRKLLSIPFLDLSGKMADLAPIGIGGIDTPGLNPVYDERGLLGLAFHPGYKTNGRFFVYYTAPKTGENINCETVLSEFRVSNTDPNLADVSSERVLLRVDQPEFNHNGGALVFGPDGYLYLGLGDGGGGGDVHPPIGNGQNLATLLGSIVRLDVDSATPYGIPSDNPFIQGGGLPEIYAYGFRNPWRVSFDRGGDRRLFVADVGQNLWEEINIVEKGHNYGWRIMEGNHVYDLDLAIKLGIDVRSLAYPIHEYPHGSLGISVIGGYVYRGTAYPELVGKYVFGDFSTSFAQPDGALYYMAESRPGILERFEMRPGGARLGRYVKGFGEDQSGELYLLSTTALGPSGTTGDIRLLRKP